jgi:hypothetical protein
MNGLEDKPIAAIQTVYKSYRFRSRLEARWAKFFEVLGVKWEYEVEGYDLGELGWYLPDFVVTSPYGRKQIYEVKPRDSKEGEEKLNRLVSLLNKPDWVYDGCVLKGDPVDFFKLYEPISCHNMPMVCPRCGRLSNGFDYGVTYYEDDFLTVGCQPCDFQTVSGGGNPDEPGLVFKDIMWYPHKGDVGVRGKHASVFMNKISIAAREARSARFEHGESGAT